MLEPANNPNPPNMVDPSPLERYLLARFMGRIASTRQIRKRNAKFEKKRVAENRPHEIAYFHQPDDPYSHLTAQVISRFAQRYDVKITPHLIRATGGKNQPESQKLALWSRRDAGLIAPHYGLSFPENAGTVPEPEAQHLAVLALARLDPEGFLSEIEEVSARMWSGEGAGQGPSSEAEASTALDSGSARLAELGHYSGATFYYGGEWYWGVDRLFHLERRLRDLGACKAPEEPYLVPRPSIDVEGVDASGLQLHFYPSLNSPYTSIIFDRTIALADACNIEFHHKPVLPMIMRGVPATPAKAKYIFLDTKREADFFGVAFGNHVTPIGAPTRLAYSLLPWATSQGKDIDLMSTFLRHAWAQGRGLHRTANMRRAVQEAGLDWSEARERLGCDDWKAVVERNQDEMVEGMGLWGVPSYRLCGPDGEPDLSVWGQDRLWLVAAEIRRRAKVTKDNY
ncbi:MAG: DsbA family protein [Gammaproteobacteria bacterium]|nr:DsbA family protein [Gammaproteobacteria bacterium]